MSSPNTAVLEYWVKDLCYKTFVSAKGGGYQMTRWVAKKQTVTSSFHVSIACVSTSILFVFFINQMSCIKHQLGQNFSSHIHI